MNLAIVTPHFNPAGYDNPAYNLRQFIRAASSQLDANDLYFAYARFPGDHHNPPSGNLLLHEATDSNLMWQKEALINSAIKQLPSDYDAVAWVDGDLLFGNPEWYHQTALALETHKVVQCFSYIRYVDHDGRESKLKKSASLLPEATGWQVPGGAIAVKRDFFDNHHLYDKHILGGGDQVFMNACLDLSGRIFRKLTGTWREYVESYMASVRDWAGKDVHTIPGTVTHLWHGSRTRRRYQERHVVLMRRQYNPNTDVRVSRNGLLDWNSDNEPLQRSARDYFLQRKEDTPRPDDVFENHV